jgi:hypothetical protein
MRIRILPAAVAVALAAGAPRPGAGAEPPVVIVRAARLIDGRGGPPLAPAMVRVEGEVVRDDLARH